MSDVDCHSLTCLTTDEEKARHRHMETRANPKALKRKPGQPTHTKREEKKDDLSHELR